MINQIIGSRHEAITAAIIATIVIGAGGMAMVNPELQELSIIIVGVVIGAALLVPYVPGIKIGHLPTSVAGVLVTSIGIYGLLTDTATAVLMWLFVLGGIGMTIEDQIRRR